MSYDWHGHASCSPTRGSLMPSLPSVATDQPTLAPSERQAAPLVELVGVGKVFPGEDLETQALKGIHLRIVPGEWLAVVGPSGSGKTTLLSILGLLDTPNDGSYRLHGTDVLSVVPSERPGLRNDYL